LFITELQYAPSAEGRYRVRSWSG